jgi:hypothetical protein
LAVPIFSLYRVKKCTIKLHQRRRTVLSCAIIFIYDIPGARERMVNHVILLFKKGRFFFLYFIFYRIDIQQFCYVLHFYAHLKGQCNNPPPPCPLIHGLNPFGILLRIREDIRLWNRRFSCMQCHWQSQAFVKIRIRIKYIRRGFSPFFKRLMRDVLMKKNRGQKISWHYPFNLQLFNAQQFNHIVLIHYVLLL